MTAYFFAPTAEKFKGKRPAILWLHSSSYDWKFAGISGSSFTDSGSTNCH